MPSPFKKNYQLKIENNSYILDKIKRYFTTYNFQFKETDENQFVFFKKFSWLQGWKMNPLNWESEINISISNDVLYIDYINLGNAHITPFAFNDLFNAFFKNLELYINTSVSFELKNEIEIKKAKQKTVYQILIILISILLFVFLGNFLKQEFNFKFLSYFSVVIGSYLSLKLINRYWIEKII